jgi:hypothetical protein
MDDETNPLQFRTFTAPVAGRYHVVSGRDPHLESDCTEECPMRGGTLDLNEGQNLEWAPTPGWKPGPDGSRALWYIDEWVTEPAPWTATTYGAGR